MLPWEPYTQDAAQTERVHSRAPGGERDKVRGENCEPTHHSDSASEQNLQGPGPTAVHALEDINLEIEAGEIFGIIGLSGAGKSTLVRVLNLLERPTTGSVLVTART